MQDVRTSSAGKKTQRIIWMVCLCAGTLMMGWYAWSIRDKKQDPLPVSIPDTVPNELIVSSTIETLSDEEVRMRFEESVRALVQEVTEYEGSAGELISYVEEKMLVIRFPGAVREQYMAAFLAIENMKERQLSYEMVQLEIIRNLDTLK